MSPTVPAGETLVPAAETLVPAAADGDGAPDGGAAGWGRATGRAEADSVPRPRWVVPRSS